SVRRSPATERRAASRRRPTTMGKEAKIGVAVLATLLIVLGVVIVKRFTGASDPPTVEVKSSESDSGPKLPKLNPPSQPTVLETNSGAPAPGGSNNHWNSRRRQDDASDPRASYMPKPPSLKPSERYGAPPADD